MNRHPIYDQTGLRPLDLAEIEDRQRAIRRARFGWGDMGSSYVDNLKADIISRFYTPRDVDNLLAENTLIKERLKEMGPQARADLIDSQPPIPTIGTRRGWR